MASTSTALGELLDHSRTLIRSLQHPSGAYPASPTFSAYRGYSWFRDGAFIADGMSAAGEIESASAFHDWCAATVLRHAGQIERIIAAADAGTPLPDNEMLPTRFTLDGEIGSDDWWDFQLDGYGTWLWAVTEHAQRHGLDQNRWADAAALVVRYLISSWSRPCFDWWEEHVEQIHGSTLGCVVGGLEAAVRHGLVDGELAVRAQAAASDARHFLETSLVSDGHVVKWLGSTAVDGSLSALVGPMSVLDPASELARQTVAAIDRELCADGGVHRFSGDTFFGGGQWPLLSCFLGLAQLAIGNRAEAERLLEWAVSTVTADGSLPEQVNWHLLDETFEQEWIGRWGPVATPLLWSHAMVLRLAAELEES
ncbi:glycoside hydrolase family 15 protein [Diaminobutyricimonas sp. TR449]|uniref:glycoside hydrolase family 15 protein n=1 Tax=Diaminobutyricimonas sp. TR449 TaxID=2708076 RepID=UPI00141E7451|nr:glycoside hydrolase family 15 protein [Diaminobutyricimonas sp. TR449]